MTGNLHRFLDRILVLSAVFCQSSSHLLVTYLTGDLRLLLISGSHMQTGVNNRINACIKPVI